MSAKTISFRSFSVVVPERWEDITSSLHSDSTVLTIADPHSGVGAIQFSPAVYTGGPSPNVSIEVLSGLFEEFLKGQQYSERFDNTSRPGVIATVGASLRDDNDFIRIWYLSDGNNVLLVSYVCEWNSRHFETQTREDIVESIEFTSQY